MPIDITNVVSSTYIFAALLLGAVLLSCRRKTGTELFPIALSQELKGFAMLGIILAHIGYFLVADHRFLFPLSIFAGIGVDMFLFLSGFGLTVSALKKTLSPKNFWLRHLPKLYVPFWLTLALFLIADSFFLHITRSWNYMASSFAGLFPHADLFQDINSPLWYFTFILFFYLAFPLLFSKRRPLLSALALYALVNGIVFLHLPLLSGTEFLYSLHAAAFPLGIVVGVFYSRYPKQRELMELKLSAMNMGVRAACMLLLLGIICYFAYYSGIGTWIQGYTSLLVMLCITLLFIIKPFRISLFYILGVFSYELYLIHWPLISRYDILYRYLPAWLATALYIPLLLGLGWLLQKAVRAVLTIKKPA